MPDAKGKKDKSSFSIFRVTLRQVGEYGLVFTRYFTDSLWVGERAVVER